MEKENKELNISEKEKLSKTEYVKPSFRKGAQLSASGFPTPASSIAT